MFMRIDRGGVGHMAVGFLLLALGAPTSQGAVINEVLLHPNGPHEEYFEILGTPGASQDGLWFVGIAGANRAEIQNVFDLSGYTFGPNGLFVGISPSSSYSGFAANAGFYGELASDSGGLRPATVTWLLVSGFTGQIETQLDFDRDGVFDSTPWTSIMDSVGWAADEGDLVYSPAVLSLPPPAWPHAISRLNGPSGNLTPEAAAAWYYGRVSDTDSLLYSATVRSSNFALNTSDGRLTPGELNIPAPGLVSWVGAAAVVLARRRRGIAR